MLAKLNMLMLLLRLAHLRPLHTAATAFLAAVVTALPLLTYLLSRFWVFRR